MSLSSGILLCHSPVLLSSVTLLCHSLVSLCCVTLWCYSLMLPSSVTLWCHVTLFFVMGQSENYAKKEGDNDNTEDDSNKMISKWQKSWGCCCKNCKRCQRKKWRMRRIVNTIMTSESLSGRGWWRDICSGLKTDPGSEPWNVNTPINCIKLCGVKKVVFLYREKL